MNQTLAIGHNLQPVKPKEERKKIKVTVTHGFLVPTPRIELETLAFECAGR
jgi:hypothetical protein